MRLDCSCGRATRGGVEGARSIRFAAGGRIVTLCTPPVVSALSSSKPRLQVHDRTAASYPVLAVMAAQSAAEQSFMSIPNGL
jgi:hypothetical protein